MSDRVLVTGGAGFVGSHLVDALIAKGHQVRVFDNLEPQVHGGLREQSQWPVYSNPEAEYVLGDVRDRDALTKALSGVDVVFHLAAMVGVGQSMYAIERYVDVNTRGTATLLDILVNETTIRERVNKVIVASSMSIYGEGKYECPVHGPVFPKVRPQRQLAAHDWELHCPVVTSHHEDNGNDTHSCNLQLRPLATDEDKPLSATSIYAISKKDQEEMCLAVGQAYDIPVVALRYFNIYGTRQSLNNPYTGVAAIFSSRLLNAKPPVIFEDGGQKRDFVHVSDVIQANLIAMSCDRAGGGVYNVGTGRPLSIAEVANVLGECLGSEQLPEITHQYRAGDIRHCFPDIKRLEALGYRPAVCFEDGVAELVSWVRTQSAVDSFEQARKELARRGLTV